LADEFQETHLLILEGFYTPFDNKYEPVQDFNKFIDDPTSVNVRGTLLYIYGDILLLLDRRVPGTVRERLIVGGYRQNGDSMLVSGARIFWASITEKFHHRIFRYNSSKFLYHSLKPLVNLNCSISSWLNLHCLRAFDWDFGSLRSFFHGCYSLTFFFILVTQWYIELKIKGMIVSAKSAFLILWTKE
jgi:hypothetical protein